MKNKDSRIRPKHFLLVLIGLCLILIIVSTVSSTVNNGVRNVINTVLMPMAARPEPGRRFSVRRDRIGRGAEAGTG